MSQASYGWCIHVYVAESLCYPGFHHAGFLVTKVPESWYVHKFINTEISSKPAALFKKSFLSFHVTCSFMVE